MAAAGISGAFSLARDYNVHRGFSTVVRFRRAGSGRLQVVHFYSRALRRRADYLVYLPPHYDPRRRLPAYYLLHGAPGQPRVFVDIANMDVRLDNQMSLGRARPMILVYPDGRIGGSTFSDSEWANTRAGRYESYVIDVMHNVDRRFAAIPRRQDRVIGGFSAGAYGAMNIALHHLADFANVQSWSGYFTQTASGVFAGSSHAALAFNSPLDYVSRLRRALRRDPLRVLMFVGRDDGSSAQQIPMARALMAAGAQVRYRFYRGGHDWSVWYPRLNGLLDAASRDVVDPPRPRAGALPLGVAVPATSAHAHRRHRRSELGLIGALVLALLSAGLINLGFVLQHRGHDHARRERRTGLASGFRERAWLLGQATGWVGFAGQIVAVALAPLTLVQAFSAGSLALSVPLAARVLAHRVTRRQLVPVALIAVSLASLPLGLGHSHGHLRPGVLIAAALLVMLAGGRLARRGPAAVLALVAGAFYGTADGAIKAASIGLRFHGAGLLTGWTLLAGLCTLGGFLAFQAALRQGDAVGPLSLMNAFTAVAAIVLGIVAFGEHLGSSPAVVGLHVAAIAVVLGCVRPLTAAQHELVADDGGGPSGSGAVAPAERPPRGRVARRGLAARLAGSALRGAVVLAGCLSALGLLYELRQLRLFAVGPHIPDALPLLQLAGFDAQPAVRVLVATAVAGLTVGTALAGLDRQRRMTSVGLVALVLMLLGSDASYALARNLPFDAVLLNRAPGLGPWLEAVVLTAASALPGPVGGVRVPGLGATRGALAGRVWRSRAWAPVSVATLAALVVLVLVAPSGHAGTRRAAGVAASPVPPPALPAPSTGRSPAGPAPSTVRPPTLPTALDAALRRAAHRIHAPGATAAIVRCGHVVWAGATGVLALGSERRASDRSLFVLGSATKTVVAAMVMREVQAGHLSLDTPVSRFLPGLPDARRISVRMLLDMTSGLPDYLYHARIAWVIRHRPRHHWTVEQVLTGLGAGLGAPAFPPGEAFRYSDTNYIVLGAILERITHRSVQRDFELLIARPLHLTAATFVPTRTARQRVAHPYLLDRDGVLRSRWIPGFGVSSGVWGPVWTDGGLASSTLDLARFANALLSGRLVDATAVREMTHIGRGNYGFGIRARRFEGRRWLGHAGYFGGFAAEDWSDPLRQLTFSAAANVERSGGGLTLDPIWSAVVRAYDRYTPRPLACRSRWPVSRSRGSVSRATRAAT